MIVRVWICYTGCAMMPSEFWTSVWQWCRENQSSVSTVLHTMLFVWISMSGHRQNLRWACCSVWCISFEFQSTSSFQPCCNTTQDVICAGIEMIPVRASQVLGSWEAGGYCQSCVTKWLHELGCCPYWCILTPCGNWLLQLSQIHCWQ